MAVKPCNRVSVACDSELSGGVSFNSGFPNRKHGFGLCLTLVSYSTLMRYIAAECSM
jgi:hypothetical protein